MCKIVKEYILDLNFNMLLLEFDSGFVVFLVIIDVIDDICFLVNNVIFVLIVNLFVFLVR